MKRLGICLLIVLAGLGFGWTRQQQLLQLRRRNDELQARVAEVARSKEAAAHADKTVPDPTELARLREEWSELMRLRSEVGRLREAARIDLPHVEAQTHSDLDLAKQEEQRCAGVLEDRAAQLHSALVRDFLAYSLIGAVKRAAEAKGGQFPASFAEAETQLERLPPREKWFREALASTNHLDPSEAEIVGRSFSVSAQDFEFIPAARPLSVKDPPTPILREAVARRLPNGQDARWYAYTDGHVQELKGTDDQSPGVTAVGSPSGP